MANRVEAMIGLMQSNLERKLASGELTAERIEATRKGLDIDASEYCSFQDLKSLAQANQKITVDEAQTVYMLLGSGPADFNSRTCAQKAALTKLLAELLNWKIGLAQSSATRRAFGARR